jgi:hypothetical protein
MPGMLSVAQRNRVHTVLRSLELDLVQARATLDAPPQEGILYRIALTMSPERRAAIGAEIEAGLSTIAALARDLDLPTMEQDPAAKIAARLSVDWADLLDSTSTTLKRYGSVDPRLSEMLDRRIESLSERALTVARLYRQDEGA